jgi:hypothetical protein
MSDWNKEAVKLVNHFGSKEEVIADSRNPIKEFATSVKNISEELDLYQGPEPSQVISPRDFIEEVSAPDPITEMPPPIKEDQESITIHVDEKTAKILKDRGTEFYCAPVIGQKLWKDELYGTSYTTNKYGTKFIFDAVIIAQSDLEIQFWCMRELTKDSIILKKDQQGGERWWRISETESKSGGHLCKGTISDLNPDFS